MTTPVNRDRQSVKVRCAIPVVSPANETSARQVAEKLRDYAEDAGLGAWVVSVTGMGTIVDVARTYAAGGLDNGTLTALAWFATELDRALDAVSEYRWFGDASITARLLESRDEAQPEPEDEGEDE